MATFGITRSMNEVDITRGSIVRMLGQVDHIIIGDNSTDGTREILEELVAYGAPITLLEDRKLNFEQRDVMTNYAHQAREMGGEWGVFFDIDEVWTAERGRISDRLAELPAHILVAHASNVTHCCTSEDDPDEPDPITRMGWRSAEKLPLGKVACRLTDDLRVGHGNHSAVFGRLRHPAAVLDLIGSRHYPYRSPEQFVKRVKGAYPMLKASGLPRTHGQHMHEYGEHWEEFGEEGLRRWFQNGMFFENPAENPDLVYDPAPGCP